VSHGRQAPPGVARVLRPFAASDTLAAVTQDSTTSALAVIGLIVAVAAFLVAIVSLYAGILRRADIRMLVLTDRHATLHNQEHRPEGPPVWGEVRIPTVVVNTGARPGVLTDLSGRREQHPFVSIEGFRPDPNFRDSSRGAMPVLSGESQVVVVEVTARFPDKAVEAWKAGTFKSFDVELSYSFVRGQRIRASATRQLTATVSVDDIVWKA
jgi:hypothetical protein